MKNLWNDRDADKAINMWGAQWGRDLALCAYGSRLIGADPALVLHGGGNTSCKGSVRNLFDEEVPALYVKGSGADLFNIEPAGFTALDLARLQRLRTLPALADAPMTNELLANRFDANAPAPSVETLLHAFLPHRYIDHSHAEALLCLSNQPEGERLLAAALGPQVVILPYVACGFPLAEAVAAALQRQPDAIGVAVAQHGLFTFGEDARGAYERHIEIVTACEKFIASRKPTRRLTPAYRCETPAAELAARIAPVLRGVLAEKSGEEDNPYRRPILDWRADDEVLAFVNSAEAAQLAAAGPITPDHVIRVRPFALFVPALATDSTEDMRTHLAAAVAEYGQRYRAYVSEHLDPEQTATATLDLLPRVVLIPGAGAFCFGRSKREARIAADITVQTLRVQGSAHGMGGYQAAAPEHLCAMEYWSLQQAKLGRAAPRPLERQVVLITGGAGAIGFGIARACAEAGAHVVVTDIEAKRLDHVVADIEATYGPGSATGIAMNVTDETSVRAGFAEACRRYGGVDVVVPNAGIAHVAAVADLAQRDLERVMNVNFIGMFHTIQEGVRVLRAQGLGGNIVVNSSKNVFGPGKDFGAYSASKAAGHQLAKVSAIELAAEGIRVNMINPDAIFAEEDIESGLWATVGPDRAQSRGMKLDELPEYYRNRNLLRVRVRARHVGNAVVFLASNQTPTTGASIPVDGGVVEAFPR
ncbi:Bifunctional aldolase/short-chain dehydrogenase [Georgfuchsia toluolica]|uniref:Bifunctional aldolase/short-chain dehydrogenase n=1 Tax=Georgfuchsia toluolica TaxID=424218 RepID=A0A916J5N3_9PROT|nr:bifunctional aldolase/short-chain dehydrogenase [Georgfuchsia toluolica]CAG4884401.1 Bifunctional aldolase/short-chain dehydrogenase [Georgfuchsia toluolica]